MANEDQGQPTQKTRPQGIDKRTGEPYEPANIPVPTRREVLDLMRAVTGKRPSATDDSSPKQ